MARHGDRYTVNGVNGETGAAVGTVDVSGTTHTNAGTYNSDPWSFTGTANYNDQNGTVNDCIAKANATVVVTPYTARDDLHRPFAHGDRHVDYWGERRDWSHGGTVDVSGTSHINAGTYNNDPWTFTGTANYNNQNGTVNDCIAKANATFTVTPYNVAYDSNPHTATVWYDHRCEWRDRRYGRHN